MTDQGGFAGSGITRQQHTNRLTGELLVIAQAIEIILNDAKQRRFHIAVDKRFELIGIGTG